MNLNKNPTTSELATLYAACDDTNANHVLWVDDDGAVHITPVPEGVPPGQLAKQLPGLRFRYETAIAGNGYVGAKAAEDEAYVSRMLSHLVRDWREGLRGYSDDYEMR